MDTFYPVETKYIEYKGLYTNLMWLKLIKMRLGEI